VVRQSQTLDHFAVLQMRFDDFINVVIVDIGVPNRLGIHHQHRPAGTPVQATGLVDTHAIDAVDTELFNLSFAMFPSGLRLMIRATRFLIFPLVQAKKYVVFEVALGCHVMILEPLASLAAVA
jgi:hypothetical protein